MATETDSIVERAQRVHRALESSEPGRVQVAVGGPCPDCGERVEIVMRTDSSGFTCRACGGGLSVSE